MFHTNLTGPVRKSLPVGIERKCTYTDLIIKYIT